MGAFEDAEGCCTVQESCSTKKLLQKRLQFEDKGLSQDIFKFLSRAWNGGYKWESATIPKIFTEMSMIEGEIVNTKSSRERNMRIGCKSLYYCGSKQDSFERQWQAIG